MKLTQIPNFRVEDFPTEQTWISKLFIQLNPFIQAVNQILNQGVDFSSNIRSVSKDYDITTFQPFSFAWPFTEATPVELNVVKSLKGTAQTPTILLAAWRYNATTAQIDVTRMVEVTDTGVATLSGRYQFSVRVTV